jgi:Asp-tRNA(Asn)/Glu-tRNA(Gln) amidotransferase A subunit family amidase
VETTVTDMVGAIRSREVSPRELVDQALTRIAAGAKLNAFLTLCGERAMEEAKQAETLQLREADLPPLLGVPIGVKDLHETAAVRTTYGSVRFASHVPSEDCLLVGRLRRAGAIVVGKTNTPAFGLSGETKNRLGPPCVNPFDTNRTVGGSSGGSAAAVAAGMIPAATGSDAAGSITFPASFCGVYGLKPTLGRVPNVPAPDDSLLFNASGPITTTVDDAALLLTVIAGHDARDPMSIPGPAAPYPTLSREAVPANLNVAFSTDLGLFAVDDEVAAATRVAARRLADAGLNVVEDTPALEDPIGLYVGLYVADARRGGLAEPEALAEFYPETADELRDTPQATAQDYVGMLNRLWRLRAAMADFFTRHEVLLVPTAATLPFRHNEPPATIGGRPVKPDWTTYMPFTPIANMTGQPTANVPVSRSHDGLPIGVLLIGPLGREDLVFQVSRLLMSVDQA